MKEPNNNEALAEGKLKEVLSQIGFNVQFSDNTPDQHNCDFIASKRVDGSDYKIAIELKNNHNVRDSIRNGIATLSRVDGSADFQKLLLLVLNKEAIDRNGAELQRYLIDHPTNLEILNLDDLEKWSEELAEQISNKEENEVLYYIRQLSKKLIELIAKDSQNLASLEWRDLERALSELFEGLGFKTTLTPGSKDGGKDIILECKIDDIQKSFIIEIKHWRSGQKVGKTAVKDFTKVIINEKRDKGVFLSTYGYTENYYESLTEKEKALVRFGEESKIVDLCRTYEKVKNGIWCPTNTLEDVLLDDTVALD